jgi:uncharacterized membrane protein
MGWQTIDLQTVIWSFLHVVAIAVYVGGAVAMEWVLGPAQRAIPPAQAQIMGEQTSRRFLLLVWIALAAIFITGVLRLIRRQLIVAEWPPFQMPLTLDFSYGRTMLVMVVIWLLLVVNGALITFLYRPRLLGRLAPGAGAAQVAADRQARIRAAGRIQTIVRVDLVLALVAVLFGVSLRLGGVW